MGSFQRFLLLIGFVILAWGCVALFLRRTRSVGAHQTQVRFCVENLQHIGQYIRSYETEHESNAPPDLVSLTPYATGSRPVFTCFLAVNDAGGAQAGARKDVSADGSNTLDSLTYIYVAGNIASNEVRALCPALHPRGHILYADGTVREVSPAEFRSVLMTLRDKRVIIPQGSIPIKIPGGLSEASK